MKVKFKGFLLSTVAVMSDDKGKAFYHSVYKPYSGEAPRKRKRVTPEQGETLEAVFQRTQHPTAVERYVGSCFVVLLCVMIFTDFL